VPALYMREEPQKSEHSRAHTLSARKHEAPKNRLAHTTTPRTQLARPGESLRCARLHVAAQQVHACDRDGQAGVVAAGRAVRRARAACVACVSRGAARRRRGLRRAQRGGHGWGGSIPLLQPPEVPAAPGAAG